MSSKRKFSETDFCDDSDGYAYGDRKKKRGEIEKKRRDRINDCLNQLKELVPTACEKSNVNKLEKVEILQMAVDHLKTVHNNPDHNRCAEHHNAGFRECMGEVSRYLVAVEGMHIEEPLRLRLMSHLHAFSATRAGSQYTWLGGHGYPGAAYPSQTGDGEHAQYLVPVSSRHSDKIVSYSSQSQSSSRSCYTDPHRTLSCYRPWGDSPAPGPGLYWQQQFAFLHQHLSRQSTQKCHNYRQNLHIVSYSSPYMINKHNIVLNNEFFCIPIKFASTDTKVNS